MKMKRLTAWILILTAVFALSSCQKKGGRENGTQNQGRSDVFQESVITAEDGSRWLTHIFKSAPMELPDGWEFAASGGIEYDAQRDEFRGLSYRMEEIEGEDGVLKSVFDRKIVV
ncbi:MAG: hypothetical protein E7576_08330 [Ruminococcaceae bacterium]|nr:hypothetical protein [Oscillospiraceae bacterium]